MFSQRYEIVCEEVSEFFHTRRGPLDSLRPMVASDYYAPFFWNEGFGLGAELDQAISAGSAELKAGLYGGRQHGPRLVVRPVWGEQQA